MTDNKTKIDWLKDYFNLYYDLGFKKSDVIAGILKKYMSMSVKIYTDKKEELIKLIDKIPPKYVLPDPVPAKNKLVVAVLCKIDI